MKHLTRRVALLGAGTFAGGTLAAATVWRKPEGPQIFTPVAAAPDAPKLGSFVPTTPPQPPAEADFVDVSGVVQRVTDFAGKGLVINLWATWCVPCVAELPSLQALAKVMAAEGVLVLPLSSDRGGVKIVQKFYADHGIDALPVWLDPKGAAARAWGVRGLPTTLIVDRQGRERARVEGAAEWTSAESLQSLRALIG